MNQKIQPYIYEYNSYVTMNTGVQKTEIIAAS